MKELETVANQISAYCDGSGFKPSQEIMEEWEKKIRATIARKQAKVDMRKLDGGKACGLWFRKNAFCGIGDWKDKCEGKPCIITRPAGQGEV